MSALAKFVGFWWLGALLFLVGCGAVDGATDGAEDVGSIAQATTGSCLTAPVAGECRYLPSVASASSVENNNSSLIADMAIDSSCGTRWSSAFSDPQWLKVDLGSSRPLSRLVIHWESAASSAYEIQVSNDNSTWTKVATKANATITGSGSSRVDTIAGLTASARYVRLYSTARTTTYGNSISELEVFGTGCGAPTSCSWIPTVPVSAAASSIEHSEKGPEKAIDGLSSTRWSSAASDPQWLRIDLGQSTTIGRVVLDWENASSAKYDVQVSESTSGPWTTIFSHVDARVGPRTDDLTALSGKGRYLRIHSTKRTTSYGIALYEVQVFRQSCEACDQILPSSSTQASSVESASSAVAAANATDGNYASRWSSAFSDPQWLRVDLGQTRRIKQVMIKWEASASKSYRIETAPAATGPWQVLAQRSNLPAGPRFDVLKDLGVSARFLRVYSTARTSTYGNSIYELVVLGGANPLVCDFACPGGTTLDTDGDGTPNCLDGCPKDPLKTKPGICDCGNRDIDSDADGLLDCQERCDTDPTNANCPNNDALGPYIPAPGPSSVAVPVNQSTCNPSSALPAALTVPSGRVTDVSLQQQYTDEQLATHFNALGSAVVASTGACSAPQEVDRCPLDPATATTTECNLDQFGNPVHSTCTAQWGPSYRCGFVLAPGCPAFGGEEACSLPTLRCALPDAKCTQLDPLPVGCTNTNGCCNPDPAACGCSEVELCSEPGFTGQSGPDSPTSYAAQPPKQVSSVITAAKQPAPAPVYTDPPNDPNCQRRGAELYCWCTLGMDNPAPVADLGSTSAKHGGGSIVSLDFDPATTFDVDLNPLPLGEAFYKVDASANFVASAAISLPIIGTRELDILDVGAGVTAQRCSLNTNGTHFKVLGKQFTDLAGNDPFDSAASDGSAAGDALVEASAACDLSIGKFIEAADRAKKALKDVQLLLKHYKLLTSNQSWKKTDFCALVSTMEEEFPAGNCTADSIEATINRFVNFYTARMAALVTEMGQVPLKTQAMLDALNVVKPSGNIKFLDFHREQSATLFSAQFFVGPIPVNISVDIAANYGVDGIFEYAFSPFNRFGMQVGDTARVIGATGKIIPSAGASLAVFAGVGFDVPGFAVKAGIEGRLVLAEIRANLEAGAGLSMRVKDDLRDEPTDPYYTALSSINAHQVYFKPTQSEYYLDWFYGASVGIPKILEGTINAKVKLKALFFSKTFKKTFLTFGPAFSMADRRIFSGGGELGGVNLPSFGNPLNTLGDFEMQTPFPMLNQLQTRPGPITDSNVAFKLGLDETPLHWDGVCDPEPPK